MRKQLKNQFDRLKQSAAVKGAAIGTGLMVLAVNAHAALDPAVDTTITAVQGDAVAMIAKGFAFAGAVVGAMIGLGLFIKVLKRAGRG